MKINTETQRKYQLKIKYVSKGPNRHWEKN